jgi:hypothetical protein
MQSEKDVAPFISYNMLMNGDGEQQHIISEYKMTEARNDLKAIELEISRLERVKAELVRYKRNIKRTLLGADYRAD